MHTTLALALFSSIGLVTTIEAQAPGRVMLGELPERGIADPRVPLEPWISPPTVPREPPSSVARPRNPQGEAERAFLIDQLAARRALNLTRFIAYRERGIFPDNHVQPGMRNVFIDDEGHICAAANLIDADGLGSIVRQVAREANDIRLADVRDGVLLDWILASGFTQQEVALIQEPYDFIDVREPSIEEREFEEKRRLQQHFTEVEAALRQNAHASLALAVDRLIAHRAAHAHHIAAPVGTLALTPARTTPATPAPLEAPLQNVGRGSDLPAGLASPIVWRPGLPPPRS